MLQDPLSFWLIVVFVVWSVAFVAVLRLEQKRAVSDDDALADAIINEAEYDALRELHEAAHPMDDAPYDITKPMSLPKAWDVIPTELRGVCYRDDEIVHD